MICYKDRTFCSAKCKTASCFRNFTKEEQESARKWWGGEGAPVAFSDFSKECKSYDPEK